MSRHVKNITALLLVLCFTLPSWARHARGAVAGAQQTVWFGATLPTLPMEFTTTSDPPSPGATCNGSYYEPTSGAQLQTDLNDAAAGGCANGDVIELQAGTTYTITTNFNLPTRSGSSSGWVYIISSDAPEIGGSGLPSEGTRVSCSSNASDLASLRSSETGSNGNVILSSDSASYYRLVGLDIEDTDNNAGGSPSNQYVVQLGHGDTSYSTLDTHITFDRDCIEGGPTTGVVHAIGLEGEYMEVTESDFENVFDYNDADNQCIAAWNSDGPYKITDNWLHAGGQNTLFGGAAASITNAIPSNIDIEDNDYFKQQWVGNISTSDGSPTITVNSTTSGALRISMEVVDSGGCLPGPGGGGIIISGSGTTWTLNSNASCTNSSDSATANESGKDNIEFKEADYVLVNHNFFTSAGYGQAYTFLAVVSGYNSWATVSNLTITNNVFSDDAFAGWNVLTQDDSGNASVAMENVLFRNNLWLFKGGANSTSLQVTGSTESPSTGIGGNIIWDHNTFIDNPEGYTAISFPNASGSLNNVVWSNNIFDTTQYEIHCAGNNSWANCGPQNIPTEPAYLNNVIVAGAQTYPSGNFTPASDSAVGWSSYGSLTSTAGYELCQSSGTPSGCSGASAYHAAGVTGLGLPYTSGGTSDGSDIGVNVSLLPTS